LFQAGSGGEPAKIPANAKPKGAPVVHFEVIGRDMQTLETFYTSLFGWKIDANNPMNYGIITREDNLNLQGVGIGGGIMALPPEMAADAGGHVTFYVEVPDVGAALDKAESLGGQKLHGPDTVPGGGPTLGQFADPEGHLVGLVQSGSM